MIRTSPDLKFTPPCEWSSWAVIFMRMKLHSYEWTLIRTKSTILVLIRIKSSHSYEQQNFEIHSYQILLTLIKYFRFLRYFLYNKMSDIKNFQPGAAAPLDPASSDDAPGPTLRLHIQILGKGPRSSNSRSMIIIRNVLRRGMRWLMNLILSSVKVNRHMSW